MGARTVVVRRRKLACLDVLENVENFVNGHGVVKRRVVGDPNFNALNSPLSSSLEREPITQRRMNDVALRRNTGKKWTASRVSCTKEPARAPQIGANVVKKKLWRALGLTTHLSFTPRTQYAHVSRRLGANTTSLLRHWYNDYIVPLTSTTSRRRDPLSPLHLIMHPEP
ncbi:mucoidy inhibitor a [Moniliophthora roreri]|nr:mucoidy inhibitor a [Moniliophthora roreri]